MANKLDLDPHVSEQELIKGKSENENRTKPRLYHRKSMGSHPMFCTKKY